MSLTLLYHFLRKSQANFIKISNYFAEFSASKARLKNLQKFQKRLDIFLFIWYNLFTSLGVYFFVPREGGKQPNSVKRRKY